MQDQGLHKQHKPWKEWGTDLNVRQLRQMQTHTRVLRELCGKLDVLAEEAESTSQGLLYGMPSKRKGPVLGWIDAATTVCVKGRMPTLGSIWATQERGCIKCRNESCSLHSPSSRGLYLSWSSLE